MKDYTALMLCQNYTEKVETIGMLYLTDDENVFDAKSK